MMREKLPWENNQAIRFLELLKEAVGFWHRRHIEMIRVLPMEHPVKIQGPTPSLIFAPSLPLGEVMVEKFQWWPRMPRIIIYVCVCIYVCSQAQDWPYMHTKPCVCPCENHVWMWRWLQDYQTLCRVLTAPFGKLNRSSDVKQASILASPLWIPLHKILENSKYNILGSISGQSILLP